MKDYNLMIKSDDITWLAGQQAGRVRVEGGGGAGLGGEGEL